MLRGRHAAFRSSPLPRHHLASSMSFPALPIGPHPDQIWSHNVQRAHRILVEATNHASRILRQDDADPLQLRVICRSLEERMVPILDALASEIGSSEWAELCARCLGQIMGELDRAAETICNSEQREACEEDQRRMAARRNFTSPEDYAAAYCRCTARPSKHAIPLSQELWTSSYLHSY
ncbi:hypothetical protein BV25DRAFT_469090 [Artomyces pyxidatus]|uniref:Uncharacterized protein n=1 Tax=Artomyces pyxidatus TaxID=48021 RepID=A0ACB8SDX3_9AGAM|nr:hypothetical protein BV25DRAFT_469090 [Artomyces pyxidatus]